MPTVVANLESAVASYEQLGFSIKPGRLHQNGLRNSHVKFKDGSGIELIAPPGRPVDALSKTYSEFLQGGEGPAYISFHARDTDALTAALNKANIPFKDDSGVFTIADPHLGFVFFIKDNRSPTDAPQHFAHRNTAVAMSAVWLALDAAGRTSLRKLLLALGAVETSETVTAPNEAQAAVFAIQNGRVIVVADTYRLRDGRKIIGAEFRVENLQMANKFLGVAGATVPPSAAHGLWLRLSSDPLSR